MQIHDQGIAELLHRLAESHREEERPEDVSLLDPEGRVQSFSSPAGSNEEEARGTPEEGFGHGHQRGRVLLQAFENRTPADARESVGDV
jgi:hypothetical protein